MHRSRDVADDPVCMTSFSLRAAARHLVISKPTLRAWSDIGVGPLPNAWGRYDSTTVATWREEMTGELTALLGPTVHATSATATP